MNDERLQQAVNDKTEPVFLKSKPEIIDYYKEKYGLKNWTSQAAMALSGTTDKKSHEYKAAIRQFQGERINQAGAKLAPKFESVGKQLPPTGRKPIGDSITITVKGTQGMGPRGGTREREITVTFTGPDALKFANKPDYRDIWEEYGVEADLFDDGTYKIDVYSVA